MHFGTQHVPLFLRALGLEGVPHADRVLEGMACIAARQHPEHQARLVAAQRVHGLEQGVRLMPTEAHFAQSRWYVQATYMLAYLESFQPVPGWISRALAGRITWSAAEEGLVVLACRSSFNPSWDLAMSPRKYTAPCSRSPRRPCRASRRFSTGSAPRCVRYLTVPTREGCPACR